MSEKIVIFPASFDPVTNGHIDLIDRISHLSSFDKLIVAIGVNPAKSTRFTLEERIEMLSEVIKPYPHAVVDQYSGLTAQYAASLGASTIVRGLRVFSDFEYEFQMARMNRQLAPLVETIFMMSDLKYAHLSSTLVSEVMEMSDPKVKDDFLLTMVPPIAVQFLKKKF